MRLNQKVEKYNAGISLMRILATLSVVWLHTCSTLAQNKDIFPMSNGQSVFFNTGSEIMQFAVPVFFMITGALLLKPEKTITYKAIMNKYILRIVLALFIFGVPFAILRIIMETGVHDLRLIPLSIKAVFENNSLAHLWYLYTLIGIYLTIPVLKSFTRDATSKEFRYLLSALIILDFAVPLFNVLTGFTIAFDIPLKYSLFYVLFGYYLTLEKEALKKYRGMFSVVTVLCVASVYFLNSYNLKPEAWTGYTSPLIAVFAGAVFCLFITANVQISDFTVKVDRLCFGVYLIHPVFIQFTYRFLKITPLQFKLYPLATLCFALIFIGISFAGSWILSKIKPLKKYVL